MSEVLTRGKVETDVTPSTGDENFSGWWCVHTEPYPCPCGEFVADYMTCAHKIIVWPTIDDPNLLVMCSVAQKHNRNPKVVEYKNEFGPCLSYYEIKSNPNIFPHLPGR